MMKKALALLMALMMVLGVGAASAETPATSDGQIVEVGGKTWYDSEGKDTTESKAAVELSKTVDGTEHENEFIVTLQAKTEELIREIPQTDPNAAVVLVMDVSGSMLYEHKVYNSAKDEWVYKYDENGNRQNRLEVAKDAAQQFVEEFAKLEGDGSRMVALIAFSSDANTQSFGQNDIHWLDVKRNGESPSNNETKVKDKIKGLSAEGGTNIEAGLMLARNVLGESAVANIDNYYTILLTDGNPTYYVAKNDTDNSEIEGSVDMGTGSTSDEHDVEHVDDMATAIRTMTGKNSRLFSICFGTTTSNRNDNTTTVWNSKPFGQCTSVDDETTVGEWLTSFSNTAYDAQQSITGLFDSFNSILTTIRVGTQAWKAYDDMGQYIQYEGPVTIPNKAGTGSIVNKITETKNADGVTTGFVWDIRNSDFDDNQSSVQYDDDGKIVSGEFVYTYKYKVTLDNLSGYVAGTPNVVNVEDKTKLDYIVTNDEGEWVYDLLTAWFAVPEVKGYDADLTFTKINDATPAAAVDGASFKVQVNGADKTWTSSGTEGVFSFADLPSGHTYTLSETTTPANHAASKPIQFEVAYGEIIPVTADGYGDFGSYNDGLAVVNTRNPGSLTITKEFGENSAAVTLPDDITFTVKNSVDETVGTVTYAQIKAGNNTISNLTPGTYTVTESGADIDGYALTTKVGDADVTANKTASVVVSVGANSTIGFENTYSQKKGKLVIEKTFEGLNTAQLDAMDKTKVAFTVKSIKTVSGAKVEDVTVTLDQFTQNGSKFTYELDDMLIGTYTVTETSAVNVPNFKAPVVTYSPASEDKTSAEVEVTDVSPATVTAAVTNKYTRKDAQSVSFTLEKIVDASKSDVKPDAQDFQFELTASIQPKTRMEVADGQLSVVGDGVTITEKDGKYILTLNTDTSASGTVTVYANADEIDNLVMSLSEIEPNGVETAWTYSGATYSYNKEYDKKWEPALTDNKASFTNTYVKNYADLTITKSITGIDETSDAWPKAKEYEFVVTNKAGTYKSDPVYLPTDDGKLSVTVPNLIPDEYIVTEVYPDTDWPDYYDVDVADPAEVKLDYGDIKSVTMTNKYEPSQANAISVKVKKDRVSVYGVPAPDQAFNFKGTFSYADNSEENPVMLLAVVEPTKAAVKINDVQLDDPVALENGEFTFTLNAANEYEAEIEIDVNVEDRQNLVLTVEEIVPEEKGYWIYDTAKEIDLSTQNSATVKFVNRYDERQYDGLRIPFSKTVKQNGNINPGENTFYFVMFALNDDPNEAVKADIVLDPCAATNKSGKVEWYDKENNIIAVTVNSNADDDNDGVVTVYGALEVTASDSELPDTIIMRELAGADGSKTANELLNQGWVYDDTAFPAEYDEEGQGWYYPWFVNFVRDEEGEFAELEISKSTVEGESISSESMDFVNEHTANTPPPQTGDDSNIALWIALMSASALCFVALHKRRSA